MRSRIIGYTLVFIVFLFFDTAFVPLKIVGVGTCFLLSATVCLGIFEKECFGALFGLFSGLFLDFATAAVFGLNAIAFMRRGSGGPFIQRGSVLEQFQFCSGQGIRRFIYSQNGNRIGNRCILCPLGI